MFRLRFLKRESELIFFTSSYEGVYIKGRIFQQEYRIRMSGGQVKPNIKPVFDKQQE